MVLVPPRGSCQHTHTLTYCVRCNVLVCGVDTVCECDTTIGGRPRNAEFCPKITKSLPAQKTSPRHTVKHRVVRHMVEWPCCGIPRRFTRPRGYRGHPCGYSRPLNGSLNTDLEGVETVLPRKGCASRLQRPRILVACMGVHGHPSPQVVTYVTVLVVQRPPPLQPTRTLAPQNTSGSRRRTAQGSDKSNRRWGSLHTPLPLRVAPVVGSRTASESALRSWSARVASILDVQGTRSGLHGAYSTCVPHPARARISLPIS